MRRRLFQRFEQRVEGLAREHVNFIDDVDLVAAPRRPHGNVLPQLADLVDAAIAGGIDLDHIHILSGRHRVAGVAGVARLGCRSLHAFQRLGEDPGGARFAHATGAGEEIRMPDPARYDRPGEPASDVLLPYEFVKPLGPIAPGDHPVGTGGRSTIGSGRKLSGFTHAPGLPGGACGDGRCGIEPPEGGLRSTVCRGPTRPRAGAGRR